MLGKGLHLGHQRRQYAGQCRGGVQRHIQLLQASRSRAHAVTGARAHVDANANHHIARRAHIVPVGADKTGGLNQNASQLAVTLQPQIIGPFDANLGPTPCSGQTGLQALGHAHAHSQRQARPVLGCQRQTQREHQRIAHTTDPIAPQPTTALRLLLCYQEYWIRQPIARTAHELGVGGIDAGQHLDRKARQLRRNRFPQSFGIPVNRLSHFFYPNLKTVSALQNRRALKSGTASKRRRDSEAVVPLREAERGKPQSGSRGVYLSPGIGGLQPRLGASMVPRQSAAPQ